MATINSVNSASINTSRISGLASGLDIDSIVSDMMKAARIPVDKLEQQKQLLLWQQEDYRTLNKSLYDFRNKAFDMKLNSTFLTRKTDSSNESVATISATAAAQEGSYTITVNSLAAGVAKGSSIALADEQDSNGNTLTLFNQFADFSLRGYADTDVVMVNINGTDLEFDLGQDTINTVAAKINNANLGVTASYDSSLNRFFLTTTATGSEAEIIINSDSAGFFANGSHNSILNLNIDEATSYNGKNASIDFGDAVGLEFAANTVAVNGLTLNLKNTGVTNITVARDIDAAVTSIKAFVDAYNETLDTLSGKVLEKRERDFLPLTDAQKKEMSDSEIEKWETKARQGLLRNDMLLQNIISDLRGGRSRIVQGIEGAYNSLTTIGITFGSNDYNGKLEINETALREALTRDPDSVKKLFTNPGSNEEKGIAVRLYELTANAVKYIADKAGSSSSFSTVDNSYIGKRLTETNQAIEKWEKKLESMENRYYAQFTAMETLINQMNTQASWLAMQFGSGS